VCKMARIPRHQARKYAMIRITAVLLVIFSSGLQGRPGIAQKLYDHPVLIADPGMHTARIRSAAIGQKFAATGSDDKTVRVWSLKSGDLLQTIRMPAGPGFIGRVFAIAISSETSLVAAGGWMAGEGDLESLYLFDPLTKTIVARIE